MRCHAWLTKQKISVFNCKCRPEPTLVCLLYYSLQDWRIALQDPAVQLGLPFDPLFATALSPQICKEERTQTQDGVCVPSPSKVPRENAWSQLLNSLIASAPPDEALAALWMRWELQVENTNIVLQDEDKDRRSQMLKVCLLFTGFAQWKMCINKCFMCTCYFANIVCCVRLNATTDFSSCVI